MKTAETHDTNLRELILFFLLAFALSWLISLPLALARQGILPAVLPTWAHYLSAFDPLISALIVTGLTQGAAGLQELGKRMLIRQICPKWWIVAFSPFLLGFLLTRLLNLAAGGDFALTDYTPAPFLPPIGFWVLLVWILTFGMGGETGWRGFALPRLQQDRSALGAAVMLAAAWALWQLPYFFYAIPPSTALPWLIGIFAGSIFLTWLYNSAVDSIPTTAIWVGSYFFLTASNPELDILQSVLIGIIVCLAVIAVLATRPKNLMSI